MLAQSLTFCIVGAHIAFGYTATHGHGAQDPNQVLLNQQQQDLMAGFWDNPDGAHATTGVDDEGSFSLSGYAVEGFGGQAHNELYQDAENAVNFTHNNHNAENGGTQLTASQGEPRAAAGPANLSQFDGIDGIQNWYNSTGGAINPTHHQSIDHMSGDGEAASALMNLSTSHGHNHEHQQPTSAGTWGNLSLMNNGGFSQDTKIPTPMASHGPLAGSSVTPHTPQAQHGSPFSSQQLLQQMTEPPQVAHSHTRHQSLQLPHNTSATFDQQWQAPTTEHREMRPPPIAYGSDDNFGQHGYHGGYHGPDGQEGNLLGVPFAGQAAAPAHVQHARAQQTTATRAGGQQQAQQRHSVPDIGHGMRGQPASPSNFDAPNFPARFGQRNMPLTAVNSMQNNGGLQQSHKRKRSQADDDDDHEYRPGNTPRRPRRGSAANRLQGGAQPFAAPAVSRRRRSIARPDSESDATSPPTPADNALLPVAATRRRRVVEPRPTRANLTEQEKRANHIQSEQKRRDNMKRDYTLINSLVPALRGGTHGESRAEVLTQAGDYLNLLMNVNLTMFQNLGFNYSDFPGAASGVPKGAESEEEEEKKYDIGAENGGDEDADGGADSGGAPAPYG